MDPGDVDAAVAAALVDCPAPGIAVSVVHTGEPALERGFGYADVARKLPVTGDTRFGIASITKLVTATAAVRLAERGVWSLDADVAPLVGPVVPPGPPITLRHLLSHTSGLDDTLLGCGIGPGEAAHPLATHLADHPPARFAAPGRVFAYTNHGAALAGLALEVAAGEPYAAIVDREVFTPFGMSASSVGGPVDALPYAADGASWAELPVPRLHDAPAGAIVSTANDLARFASAHLSDPALASMRRRWFAAAEGVPGMGLGWFEGKERGFTTWSHEGSMGGYQGLLTLVPELGLGVVVLTNGASDRCDLPSAVTSALVAVYPPAAARPADPPPTSPLPPVSGRYRVLPRATATFERVAGLLGREVTVSVDAGTVSIGGEPWARVGPVTFADPDSGARVAFVLDPELGWLMTSGPRTYGHVPGLARASLQGISLLVALITSAVGALGAPLVAMGRRRAGVHLVAGWTLAAAITAFYGLFAYPFVRAGGPEWIPYGPPAGWVARAPLLAVAIAAWVATAGWIGARTRSRAGRCSSATLAVAGAVAVLFALGWRLARG